MRAFFFHFVGLGHIYPALPLMRELQTEGIEITAYGLEHHKQIIESSGVEFRAYTSQHETPVSSMNLASMLIEWINRILPGILDDAKKQAIDFVITDAMQPAGWYLAKMMNLPLIVSTPIFVANQRITEALGIQDFMGQHSDPDYDRYFRDFEKAQAEFRSRYDIEPLSARDSFQIPGDLTIVSTSRILQPVAELLDESYKFVGPLLENRNDAPDVPVNFLNERQSIYISLGTLAHNPEFFAICVEAFQDASYNVLISSGGKNVDFAKLPDHIMVQQYVPQLEVLQHVDLFVTHGGWNSINEALYYNVPLVLCPQGKDQFANAAIVERIGAGKQIQTMTVNALQAIVNQVLTDDSFQQKAEQIGENLRSCGGTTEAVKEIRNFLRLS